MPWPCSGFRTGRILLGVAALCLFLLRPASGQAQVAPDSLASLTRRIAQLEQDLDALRHAPTPSPPPAQVVKPGGKEPGLTLGGFVQLQGEFRDRGDARFSTGNDRLYVRRARLSASSSFLEDYEFRVEFELAGSLTETSGMRAQLTDGFIAWNRFPAAVVSAGQFKTPFGFEQLYSDLHTFTAERSLANDRLTLSRQLGVQLGGDLLDRRAGYAVGVFDGTGVNNNFNDGENFLYVARVTATPWQVTTGDRRWALGADGFDTHDMSLPGQPAEWGFDSTPGDSKPDNTFAGRRRGFGLDTQLHVGRADIWLEYLQVHFQPANQLPQPRFDARGGYAQLAVFLAPRRCQAVLKLEVYDPDRARPHDRTNNLLVGVNNFIKGDDIRMQVNYLRTFPEKPATGKATGQDKLIVKVQTIF